MNTIDNAANTAAGAALENDWRFAELIAATWLEPELSIRYTQSPAAVLAEFGILLREGEAAPALPAATELDLLVEEFDRLSETSPDLRASLRCFQGTAVADGLTPEAALA